MIGNLTCTYISVHEPNSYAEFLHETLAPGPLRERVASTCSFVRDFTNFGPTDIIVVEKFHGGRIVTIGTQFVTQSAPLSDCKSWTSSIPDPQCRPVTTTDWHASLRST